MEFLKCDLEKIQPREVFYDNFTIFGQIMIFGGFNCYKIRARLAVEIYALVCPQCSSLSFDFILGAQFKKINNNNNNIAVPSLISPLYKSHFA